MKLMVVWLQLRRWCFVDVSHWPRIPCKRSPHRAQNIQIVSPKRSTLVNHQIPLVCGPTSCDKNDVISAFTIPGAEVTGSVCLDNTKRASVPRRKVTPAVTNLGLASSQTDIPRTGCATKTWHSTAASIFFLDFFGAKFWHRETSPQMQVICPWAKVYGSTSPKRGPPLRVC